MENVIDPKEIVGSTSGAYQDLLTGSLIGFPLGPLDDSSAGLGSQKMIYRK